MYKTWNHKKNRDQIIKIFKNVEADFADIINCSNLSSQTEEEIKVLESLCEHECIQKEVQNMLKTFFLAR
jgi:hypothetical protein